MRFLSSKPSRQLSAISCQLAWKGPIPYNVTMSVLRKVGVLLGHLLVAWLGTAILTAPIARAYHPASVAGVLWRELILSIVGGGLIGFGMYRTWRSKIGAWIWTLPTVLFAFHALSVSLISSQSALVPTNGLWYRMFGFDCVNQVSGMRCVPFFIFTIPLVRAVAYSLGTLVGVRFAKPPVSTVAEVKIF
jgi:hypothetical protein